jgi:hypothetical protein
VNERSSGTGNATSQKAGIGGNFQFSGLAESPLCVNSLNHSTLGIPLYVH